MNNQSFPNTMGLKLTLAILIFYVISFCACSTSETPEPTPTPPPVGNNGPDSTQAPSTDNLYVAVDGNDSNSGTESQPFATIQKAIDNVQAGKKIFVKAGTFDESLSITKNGIVIEGQGEAKITPSTGVALQITANDVTIQNLTFENGKSRGIIIENTSGVKIMNCSVNNFDNSGVVLTGINQNTLIRGGTYFENAKLVWGASIQVTNGTVNGLTIRSIEGYSINHNFDASDDNKLQQYIIQIEEGGNSNVLIDSSYFHDSNYYALNLQSRGPTVPDNSNFVIRNNRFEFNGKFPVPWADYYEGGMIVWECDSILVENNFFNKNAGWCVDDAFSTNRTYRNNIFANPGEGVPAGVSQGEGVGLEINGGLNNKVYNNLFYGCSEAFMANHFDANFGYPDGEVELSNNIFWNNILDVGQFARVGFTTITKQLNNLQNTDPLFVNEAMGNFHLSPGSPAIDTGWGDDPEIPNFDFDGRPRPTGAAIDIGPFEGAN